MPYGSGPPSNFCGKKRRQLRPICLKGRRLIGGKKHRLNRSHQFDTVLQPIFKVPALSDSSKSFVNAALAEN